MIYKLLGKIEKFLLKKIRLKNSYPPLFIIGIPRSGTTVVYLHAINTFKFSFFPNIANQYKNAVIFSTLWGRLFYHYSPTYKNRFGIIEGNMSPCDGWEIFHHWFPRYDLENKVKTSYLYQLKTLVKVMEFLFRGPFINKNNNNCIRINYLAELFPKSLFIYVKRNFYETVASILDSRGKNNISPTEWWSVAPPHFYNQTFSSTLERVVYQVFDVTQFIEKSMVKIPQQRWFEISYEDFCKNPDPVIEWIKKKYKQNGISLQYRKNDQNKEEGIKFKQRKYSKDFEKEVNLILDKMQSLIN